MLHFILQFVLFLVVSAIAINGWYNVTRGRWEIAPDGSKKWVGKIFNFWGKFLQQHTEEIQYYTNEQFLNEFAKIREFFKDDDIYQIVSNGVIVKPMIPKKATLFYSFAQSKGLNVSLNEQEKGPENSAGTAITIFKVIFHYKLPYLLRYPLGECVSCMASIYGTISWIFFYNILSQTDSILMGFSLISKIGLWAIFILSLSYLNELVFNINYSKSK